MLLSLTGCALLFFGIWGVTVTMPTKLLVKNFPEDVQECLRPRVEEWEKQPMSFRRFLGWIILILFCAGYLGLFVLGGLDGLRNGYTFWESFLRFFIIGAVIKAFDIGALDYFLLTKTRFFQHYFPETAGCAGWQDFGYNRKQQIRDMEVLEIATGPGLLAKHVASVAKRIIATDYSDGMIAEAKKGDYPDNLTF